jgi:Lon protease-like protein
MNEDVIAIFPLPNVVFFPKTILPLHIFEPRYCQMIRDTIKNKQLIGMFLLQEGWQEDYYGNPPIHPIGCAGEMIHMEALPEGKYDIVLRGLYRARPLEVIQEFPYRRARVEVLDETINEETAKVDQMKEKLFATFQKLVSLNSPENPTPQFESSGFVEIVNQIATDLPMELETRYELLKTDDLYARSELVYQLLQKRISVLDWTSRFSRLRPEDPNKN